ncbi:MAG: hypothetical protein AAF725_14970, partial [Acidobacteriota bacterium]
MPPTATLAALEARGPSARAATQSPRLSAPPWRVVKLGGTSMGSRRAARAAAECLLNQASSRPVAVVVSALAGITDELERMLQRAGTGELHERPLAALVGRHLFHLRALVHGPGREAAERALGRLLGRLRASLRAVALARRVLEAQRVEVLSAGERLSAEIMLAACRDLAAGGERVEAIDPSELLLAAGPALDAEVEPALGDPARLLGARAAGRVWVMPGFFAGGRDGRLRLLGRGGSDTSATALAALLGADRVEIWTDVDGVFPRDPRRHPEER